VADSQHPQPADPTEALERLGRLSLRELSMDNLLQTVADLAKNVMPGNPETSVSLLVKDRPATIASTGRLATDLDETQYDEGHGPCLHAARTGELTEIPDTRSDDRWPDYAPRAVEHGNLSSLSVPLSIDEKEEVTGALNIYARSADAFDEASRSVATRFAPYAAVAAGNLYAYQSAREMADNLQTALESRHRPGEGHPDGTAQADCRPGIPGAGSGLDARQQEAPRHRRPLGHHRGTPAAVTVRDPGSHRRVRR